jgi:hypothetical protein
MLVLAAVEAGPSEPLPWLLVLDELLKKIWQGAKDSSDRHDFHVLKPVMEELTMFAHGIDGTYSLDHTSRHTR